MCNPWPRRGVVLVTLVGNLFSQDSPATAAEGWSRTYQPRRLLSKAEWLLVDEPEVRDLFLAALFSVYLPLPWRYPYWSSTRARAYSTTSFPNSGANVPCVGGPLRCAGLSVKDHAEVAGSARSGPCWGLTLIVYSIAIDVKSVCWEPVTFVVVTVLLLFLVLLFQYRRRRGRRCY